ncbi:MAG: TetR/AcrR family transcriptional regulator [bacterium]|nr:TetR/AcrR family transcriptional regulator [bacterium]
MEITEKRKKIMTAAAATFAKYGYKKTTIDEIVAVAGISKGLFYHYYENKTQIYLHLYNTYVDIMADTIHQKIDMTETDFIERLKTISHIRIAFINDYPDLWEFLYSAYYEQHPDIAPLIKEKNNLLVKDSFQHSAANIDWSQLRSDITPNQAIMMVTWMAEGFVRRLNFEEITSDKNLYQEFDCYIDFLKNGLYQYI